MRSFEFNWQSTKYCTWNRILEVSLPIVSCLPFPHTWMLFSECVSTASLSFASLSFSIVNCIIQNQYRLMPFKVTQTSPVLQRCRLHSSACKSWHRIWIQDSSSPLLSAAQTLPFDGADLSIVAEHRSYKMKIKISRKIIDCLGSKGKVSAPISCLIFEFQTKCFDLVTAVHSGHELVIFLHLNWITNLRGTLLQQTIITSAWIAVAIAFIPL